MEFKEIVHWNCKCLVSKNGEVYTQNGKGEFIKRKHRYNADGYPVVSATGWKNEDKIFRSIPVHILVAKAWVPNPNNKPEVNHKDFDRTNCYFDNLEWVTHQENINYSYIAGKYKGKFGKDNPNYGNNTLHKRYVEDKQFAKEKQSRPGGRNGKAKSCELFSFENGLIGKYDFQRAAVYELIALGVVPENQNLETIIKKLKNPQGYKGYYLIQTKPQTTIE